VQTFLQLKTSKTFSAYMMPETCDSEKPSTIGRNNRVGRTRSKRNSPGPDYAFLVEIGANSRCGIFVVRAAIAIILLKVCMDIVVDVLYMRFGASGTQRL